MRIVVVGAGYVGLVTATCFAEMGNNVVCIDTNVERTKSLRKGVIPIFEPGLSDLVESNVGQNRLHFDSRLAEHLEGTELLFVAVGTPTGADGATDTSQVISVASEVGNTVTSPLVVVNKSTVPVGTGKRMEAIIQDRIGARMLKFSVPVVSNPEFLKEGAAIADFLRPDRIVVGSDTDLATALMLKLYDPFVRNGHPVLVMNRESAEVTKYAANCMLALRISFMNDVAALCDSTGADIGEVKKGVGTDSRIGPSFLHAGLGYGGSCFPKDVRAFISTANDNNLDYNLLKEVERSNLSVRLRFLRTIELHFGGNLFGLRLALWGLAFKPNTDDVREAPALHLARELVSRGATVVAYDPHASNNAKVQLDDLGISFQIASEMYEATLEADALVLATEWSQFRHADFGLIGSKMRHKTVFDGRNLYSREEIEGLGFAYYCIGK